MWKLLPQWTVLQCSSGSLMWSSSSHGRASECTSIHVGRMWSVWGDDFSWKPLLFVWTCVLSSNTFSVCSMETLLPVSIHFLLHHASFKHATHMYTRTQTQIRVTVTLATISKSVLWVLMANRSVFASQLQSVLQKLLPCVRVMDIRIAVSVIWMPDCVTTVCWTPRTVKPSKSPFRV